jgi:hypothetical protein
MLRCKRDNLYAAVVKNASALTINAGPAFSASFARAASISAMVPA